MRVEQIDRVKLAGKTVRFAPRGSARDEADDRPVVGLRDADEAAASRIVENLPPYALSLVTREFADVVVRHGAAVRRAPAFTVDARDSRRVFDRRFANARAGRANFFE